MGHNVHSATVIQRCTRETSRIIFSLTFWVCTWKNPGGTGPTGMPSPGGRFPRTGLGAAAALWKVNAGRCNAVNQMLGLSTNLTISLFRVLLSYCLLLLHLPLSAPTVSPPVSQYSAAGVLNQSNYRSEDLPQPRSRLTGSFCICRCPVSPAQVYFYTLCFLLSQTGGAGAFHRCLCLLPVALY